MDFVSINISILIDKISSASGLNNDFYFAHSSCMNQ